MKNISKENFSSKSIIFQILKNIEAYYTHIIYLEKNTIGKNTDIGGKLFDSYLIRDKQMADNLFWLINNKFRNEKIIISTSTYHISKNLDGIKEKNKFYSAGIPMGQYLYESYKDDIFNISFIIEKGKLGYVYEYCRNNSKDNFLLSKEEIKQMLRENGDLATV